MRRLLISGRSRGSSFLYFLTAVALLQLHEPAVAAQRDGFSAALAAIRPMVKTSDLARLAGSVPYNTIFVREGLAFGGAYASLGENFYRDREVMKQVVKLVTFAALLELSSRGELDKWPAEEPLFGLGPDSLAALRLYANLAGESGDPILPLLRRWPAIDDAPERGEYRAARFDFPWRCLSLLIERADVPWRDLGPDWKLTTSNLEPSGSQNLPASIAFVLPLREVPALVVAAKAYLAFSRLAPDSPLGGYCLIIAGRAFNSLSQGSGSIVGPQFARSAVDIFELAARKFRDLPDDNFVLQQIEGNTTEAKFFARDYAGALRAYEKWARNAKVARGRAANEWQAAVCQLALNADVRGPLRRGLDLLRVEADPHLRYLYASLIQALRADTVLPSKAERERWQPVIASWRKVKESDRYRWNGELLSVLGTLCRPDLGIEMLLPEIGRIHGQSDKGGGKFESHYMHELGAFLTDAFSRLSWRQGQGGEDRQLFPGARWSRLFPKTPLDRMLPRGGPLEHYGMVSPEEDRVVTLQLYGDGAFGMTDFNGQDLLKPYLDELPESKNFEQQAVFGSPKAFAKWAREELARKPPNLVPLLKLVWVEWGFVPFEAFLSEDVEMATWRYHPINASGLTDSVDLERRLASLDVSTEPEAMRIWRLFRTVHDFLEKTYPDRSRDSRHIPPGLP